MLYFRPRFKIKIRIRFQMYIRFQIQIKMYIQFQKHQALPCALPHAMPCALANKSTTHAANMTIDSVKDNSESGIKYIQELNRRIRSPFNCTKGTAKYYKWVMEHLLLRAQAFTNYADHRGSFGDYNRWALADYNSWFLHEKSCPEPLAVVENVRVLRVKTLMDCGAYTAALDELKSLMLTVMDHERIKRIFELYSSCMINL